MPKKTLLYVLIGLGVVAVVGLAATMNGDLFQGYLKSSRLQDQERTTTLERTTTTDRTKIDRTKTTDTALKISPVTLSTTLEKDGLIDALAIKLDTATKIDSFRFQASAKDVKVRRFYIFLNDKDVSLSLDDSSRLMLDQGLDVDAKILDLNFSQGLDVGANSTLKIRADMYDVGNNLAETFSAKILDVTILDSKDVTYTQTVDSIEYTFTVAPSTTDTTYTTKEVSTIESTYVAPATTDTPTIESTYVAPSTIDATYTTKDVSTIESTYVAPTTIDSTYSIEATAVEGR